MILQELKLSLDRRIPLEAVVLQRLSRLPTARQHEWLRQLLLGGFRSECQLLKAGLPETPGSLWFRPVEPQLGVATPVAGTSLPPSEKDSTAIPTATSVPATAATSVKPFSHLQHVIGDPSSFLPQGRP